MNAGAGPGPEQIAQRGRHELDARLRAAILRQAALATHPVPLTEPELDRLVDGAAARAGGVLWRRCLAGAAVELLGIDLAEAMAHPLVEQAHVLVGAPPFDPPPEPPAPRSPTGGDATGQSAETAGALRLSAIHLSGIDSLRNGESDLELRFSDAGLDLIKASSGAAIGRLLWSEIHDVEVTGARRGVRPGRRAQELCVSAQRGRAVFELTGMTAEQVKEHLEPVLARVRGT